MRSFWLLCVTINVWSNTYGPSWYVPIAIIGLFTALVVAFEADE